MGSNDCSFDVVSRVDLQEVDNAINQARKELGQRFDFKGSKSTIEWNRDEKKITLVADDDLKLQNLKDIVATRLAARKVSLKSLTWSDPERAFDGMVRQGGALTLGIAGDKAKELVKEIKRAFPKAQPSIQGEEVRVSSRSKDELQAVIQHLKTFPFALPLQFTNFRS